MATQPTQPQQPKPVPVPVPAKAAAQPVPPVQPKAQQATPLKPQKTKKFFHKPDWLFILAVLFVFAQIGVLLLLHNTKQAYIALKQEDADRIYILQKATTVSQKDIDLLEESFLREDGIVSFIQSLESAQAIFNDFDFRFTSDIPQGKDNQYLSFEIVASGTKNNIRLFLGKLLSSKYALEATKIDITTDDEDQLNGQLSMTGNMYIQIFKK